MAGWRTRRTVPIVLLLFIVTGLIYEIHINSSHSLISSKLLSTYTPTSGCPVWNRVTSKPNPQDPNSLVEHRPESQPNDSDKPVHVMIITQMRSGSSFLGELFNMNDDFTYFFEPLHDVREIIYKANDSIILMKYLQVPLRNILKCDFKNMPMHWWHPPMKSNVQSRPGFDCLFSEAFHNSSLCTYNERERKYVPIRFVENNVTVLEDLCRSRKHVALKSIRVADIHYLRNLAEDSRLNVKIIHLVRDPRGAYNSRLRVKWPPTIQESCARLERNTRLWSDTPEWLKNKYHLLRYEDIAAAPVRVADEIYRYLGIPMPRSVKVWLEENTVINTGNNDDKFSHTRDSSVTATKWRQTLALEQVMKVQSHCQSVMRTLGYKTVNSPESLRDFSINVVEPLSRT